MKVSDYLFYCSYMMHFLRELNGWLTHSWSSRFEIWNNVPYIKSPKSIDERTRRSGMTSRHFGIWGWVLTDCLHQVVTDSWHPPSLFPLYPRFLLTQHARSQLHASFQTCAFVYQAPRSNLISSASLIGNDISIFSVVDYRKKLINKNCNDSRQGNL